MIEGKTVLAVIPARGKSERLRHKNILDLGGKPLLAWTIEAAQNSSYIDRLILSSDDAEIIAVAEQWGCEVPFIRPDELASEAASSADVVRHALAHVGEDFDYVVLLQPTSPFRRTADVEGCLELCLQRAASSAVSVRRVEKSLSWMYGLAEDGTLRPVIQTRGNEPTPPVYVLNGAVYVVETDWFRQQATFVGPETVAYVMAPEQSLDIDTRLELDFARFLLQQGEV
ncbi:acylneuraminate cytidylyltransferase family protein [Magnetospira thiophila]